MKAVIFVDSFPITKNSRIKLTFYYEMFLVCKIQNKRINDLPEDQKFTKF